MNTELFNALIVWERWGKGYREKLYEQFEKQNGFIEDLVAVYEQEPALRAQTAWLMRQYLEQGNTIDIDLLERIMVKTPELDFWWPKASLLRVVTLGVKNKEMAHIAEKFVRSCLDVEKIALRAFSREAFGVLAVYEDAYKAEVIELCEEGLESSSAAVFVKCRDALKKLK